MQLKSIYNKLERPFELMTKWVGFVGAVATAVSAALRLWASGSSGLLLFLRENLYPIWLTTLSAAALGLLIVAFRNSQRFSNRFSDKFHGDLRDNWDFEGAWRIADKGTLLVTQSEAGGLSKIGATWENYTFSFEARIIKTCLGVVIRASDLNNYYMLQISADRIRPHRRVAMPVTAPPPTEAQGDFGLAKAQYVSFQIAWQIFEPPVPIAPPLENWFRVQVVARGESVKLYIDDQLKLQRDAFLKIPTGKVGFRNGGDEEALIRNVRVKVHG